MTAKTLLQTLVIKPSTKNTKPKSPKSKPTTNAAKKTESDRKKKALEEFQKLRKTLNPQAIETLSQMPYPDFLRTKYWETVRNYAIAKSNGCSLCNSQTKLQVHHRTYTHRGSEYKYLDDLTGFA